jgi:hypothetical protein
VDLSIITVVCIFHEYKCSCDYQDGNQFGFSDRINNLELMADKQNYIILVRFYCGGSIMYYSTSNEKDKKRRRNQLNYDQTIYRLQILFYLVF